MLNFTFSFKQVKEIPTPETSALMQPIFGKLKPLEHG